MTLYKMKITVQSGVLMARLFLLIQKSSLVKMLVIKQVMHRINDGLYLMAVRNLQILLLCCIMAAREIYYFL